MANNLKTIIDINSSEIISSVLAQLLNLFPLLPEEQSIAFGMLKDTSGIAFFPTSGSVLLENREDITGSIHQLISYPFNVVFRLSPKTEEQKMRVKEFLDMLGKWLERQPLIINGEIYQLEEYPLLDSNRAVQQIARSTPSHLDNAYADGVEDWVIGFTLNYTKDY